MCECCQASKFDIIFATARASLCLKLPKDSVSTEHAYLVITITNSFASQAGLQPSKCSTIQHASASERNRQGHDDVVHADAPRLDAAALSPEYLSSLRNRSDKILGSS